MVLVFGGFRTFRRGDPCGRPDRYYRDAVSRRGEPVCPPENHHP